MKVLSLNVMASRHDEAISNYEDFLDNDPGFQSGFFVPAIDELPYPSGQG